MQKPTIEVLNTLFTALLIVDWIPVTGKTPAQIEAVVIGAYHPKHVVNPPMVVCEIKKYQSEGEKVFSVMGLVNQVGVFLYPSAVQYDLIGASMFAGGYIGRKAV